MGEAIGTIAGAALAIWLLWPAVVYAGQLALLLAGLIWRVFRELVLGIFLPQRHVAATTPVTLPSTDDSAGAVLVGSLLHLPGGGADADDPWLWLEL